MEHFVTPSDTLYILGDLFEVWIGDDDITDKTARSTKQLLKAFTTAGGTGYFMHGNRDFLIAEDFSQQTGFNLIQEPYHLTLGKRNSVLLHGDSLCTDDVEYQKFKAMVRNPEWQSMFLAKPLEERRAIADGMRAKSMESAQMKAEDIMDVSDAAVDDLLHETGAETIIHGHTHRQNRHQIASRGQTKERIVLGDWGRTCSVLIVDNASFVMQNLTLEQLSGHSN